MYPRCFGQKFRQRYDSSRFRRENLLRAQHGNRKQHHQKFHAQSNSEFHPCSPLISERGIVVANRRHSDPHEGLSISWILRSGGYRGGTARCGVVSCPQDEQLVCALLAHSGSLVPAERMKTHFLPSACQCFRGTWQDAPASFGSNQCEIARLSSWRTVTWPSRCIDRPRSKSGLSNHPSCRRKPIAAPPSLGVRRRHKSACATKFGNKLGLPLSSRPESSLC